MKLETRYKKTKCIDGCELFNDEKSYSYWENKKETLDEIEILNFINSNNSSNLSKILHIGIGNSYISRNLNKYSLINGISISSNEIFLANNLNIKNYNVFFKNKYEFNTFYNFSKYFCIRKILYSINIDDVDGDGIIFTCNVT